MRHRIDDQRECDRVVPDALVRDDTPGGLAWADVLQAVAADADAAGVEEVGRGGGALLRLDGLVGAAVDGRGGAPRRYRCRWRGGW